MGNTSEKYDTLQTRHLAQTIRHEGEKHSAQLKMSQKLGRVLINIFIVCVFMSYSLIFMKGFLGDNFHLDNEIMSVLAYTLMIEIVGLIAGLAMALFPGFKIANKY